MTKREILKRLEEIRAEGPADVRVLAWSRYNRIVNDLAADVRAEEAEAQAESIDTQPIRTFDDARRRVETVLGRLRATGGTGDGILAGLVGGLILDLADAHDEAGTDVKPDPPTPGPEPRTITLVLPRGFRMLIVRED
jgi:hypothetical protein